jgi:hypothetical protein
MISKMFDKAGREVVGVPKMAAKERGYAVLFCNGRYELPRGATQAQKNAVKAASAAMRKARQKAGRFEKPVYSS